MDISYTYKYLHKKFLIIKIYILNNALKSLHCYFFPDPYIPYEVDVAAATQIGRGDIITKFFFTEESGTYLIYITSDHVASPSISLVGFTVSCINLFYQSMYMFRMDAQFDPLNNRMTVTQRAVRLFNRLSRWYH